jgi:hypothetical protein
LYTVLPKTIHDGIVFVYDDRAKIKSFQYLAITVLKQFYRADADGFRYSSE